MFEGKPEINPWRIIRYVLPQHTDHSGVMWHGAYLTWLEESRIQALTDVDCSYGELSRSGFELPVVNLQINYKSALLHGDKVLVESWCDKPKGVRWRWRTAFKRENGSTAAEARVELVLVSKVGEEFHLKRNIPKKFSSAFSRLQKGPLK